MSFFHDYRDGSRAPINHKNFVASFKPKREPESSPALVAFAPALQPIPDFVTDGLRKMAEILRSAPAMNGQAVMVQKALDHWDTVCRTPGVGHTEFLSLSRKLRNIGLDDAEIRQHLQSAAWKARHPKKRIAEIEGFIRDTRKRK